MEESAEVVPSTALGSDALARAGGAILWADVRFRHQDPEGKTPEITSAIQTGMKDGMIDMETSIWRLYAAMLVEDETRGGHGSCVAA